MADEVNYAAPIGGQVLPGSTVLRPVFVSMDLEAGEIRAKLKGDNGVNIWAEWSDAAGDNATALIVSLNSANLTSNTLKKRLLTRANADGKLPAGGTVS